MSEQIRDITSSEQSTPELLLVDSIHAGFPSPAADYTDHIDITREMIRHPETTFYAKISGDSMKDAGICSNDIVVIDRSLRPQNGNFVVAYIDGEFTVKEFKIDSVNHCAWLLPHNVQFKPICVNEDNDFVVWGVITHCIHSFIL